LAHGLLSFLALLLIRVAETRAGRTWRSLRREIERMHLGYFQGSPPLLAELEDVGCRRCALNELHADDAAEGDVAAGCPRLPTFLFV
jgi:hypothetical protein